jgi:hypothetical protein
MGGVMPTIMNNAFCVKSILTKEAHYCSIERIVESKTGAVALGALLILN